MPHLYPELFIPIYGTIYVNNMMMSFFIFFAFSDLIYLFATPQINVSSINNNLIYLKHQ